MQYKKAAVILLTLLSAGICLSGIFFIFYSWMNNISFKVLNTNISGILFGVAALYLGFRYLLSVLKLKKELYKESSVFSWSNFRKQKTAR
ncbi:hypothetical protein Cpap_0781 [Ruminiclostridium papyrosolvens DSM 2782]|uniref:Uncharacterized protein n=1 Tax=Ruminiclostridium papyrosolvens DSM 2782 TaxID=588581 RepID=F1TGG3_9FIRM|nr:hypothetical protein [Ruminiclostridium papyrosolvens]EGD46528.1 hypothetical protein Cpap_0781 [Ruminiclostridium papyrosolvens DSM 2782]WES35259.1 hypothetical protein P0092_04550 [Ruminiclostridium papyrosolvens DSM 2782]